MAINFTSFEQTEEWLKILSHLSKLLEDLSGEVIAAAEQGNVSKVQFLAGKMAMIKEVQTVPEWLHSIDHMYKGKEKPDAPNIQRQ